MTKFFIVRTYTNNFQPYWGRMGWCVRCFARRFDTRAEAEAYLPTVQGSNPPHAHEMVVVEETVTPR